MRLGIEREHEAQAFGQRLTFLHIENMRVMRVVIEAVLRATGTYWRGRAKAGKVQLNRNTVGIANLSNVSHAFTFPRPHRSTSLTDIVARTRSIEQVL